MGVLYHFYCFDAGYHTFRVTNYTNYCPQARNHLGYPVCVELWPQPAVQIDDPVAVALRELRAFGVVDDTHEMTFSDVQPCRRIHAMFATGRVETVRKLRYDLKKSKIMNLMWAGVMGEDDTFLLYEILRDAHKKIINMKI
jgi:hypothetical protein